MGTQQLAAPHFKQRSWQVCHGGVEEMTSPVPSIFISYSYKLPEEAEAWHTDTQDACSRCSTAGLDHK